jgi:uncharacterized membrane protein (DUF106 family)
MRKLLLVMFIGTSLYFCFPAVAVAEEGDKPQPPRPKIEQQMQRIRNAQNELQEQRQQLDRERQELERQRDRMQPQRQWPARKKMYKGGHKPMCGLLMVMCLAVHILVAVWVFQDIRTRGTGSGIWIVIALLAGLLGALVYAVVRLGDVKQS